MKARPFNDEFSSACGTISANIYSPYLHIRIGAAPAVHASVCMFYISIPINIKYLLFRVIYFRANARCAVKRYTENYRAPCFSRGHKRCTLSLDARKSFSSSAHVKLISIARRIWWTLLLTRHKYQTKIERRNIVPFSDKSTWNRDDI